MKKSILFVLFAVVTNILFAVEIDMDKAIKMATENNYDVKKSEKDLDTAKLDRSQALKAILPTLSYSGQYGRTENPSKAPGAESMLSSFGHTFTLAQPIYVGGMEWAGLDMSLIGEKLGKSNLDQKKRDIKIAVIGDYLAVLKAEKNKAILENAVKEMKGNYDRINEMFSLNMIPKTTLLEIKYRMIELDSNLVAANTGVELSKLALKNRIGISGAEEIKLKEFSYDAAKIQSYKVDEDLKYASSNKIVLKVLDLGRKLKEQNKNIARGDIMPQVFLALNYNLKSTELDKSIDGKNGYWSAGISFNMKLWNWGSTFDKMGQKDNEIDKHDYDVKAAKENIELAVRSGFFEMDRLKKLLDSKREALNNTKENYTLEKEKFSLNMSTSTDFLAAENLLRKSETELANTEYDYYLSVQKYKYIVEREGD